jgi:hypothetical protein
MAMTLITTNTSSDAANSSFTSGIDSTYKLYIFKFSDINPATNLTRFNFQVNASGQTGFNETMTTTYFDAYHYESGDPYGPELRYVASQDQAQGTSYQNLTPGLGSGSDECCAGVLHLFNPSSTTYVKHFYATINSVYSAQGADSAATFNNFIAGYVNTTSAIDEISFKMTSGNLDGVIQMYGIA